MAGTAFPTFQNTSGGALPGGLLEVLAPLRQDLERVRDAYWGILADVSPHTAGMVGDRAHFAGKRLRPALTCLAARIAGGEVDDDVAKVAAIVELIHTATLVHDDIIDGADVRRRLPTLNSRYGDQAAVLVGDVLFSRAYRTAAYLDDRFASQRLVDAVGEVLEGEIRQDAMARTPDLTEAQYCQIIRGKTAALYEAALVVGAHYGGGDEALKEGLGRYGHHLGMAFQIVDDRLDLRGDEQRVGKTLGTDLSEGKTTLPLILWRDALPEEEQADGCARIAAAWDDPEAARWLAAALDASGALAAADRVARVEVERALEALVSLPASPEREMLCTLARFTVDRTL